MTTPTDTQRKAAQLAERIRRETEAGRQLLQRQEDNRAALERLEEAAPEVIVVERE